MAFSPPKLKTAIYKSSKLSKPKWGGYKENQSYMCCIQNAVTKVMKETLKAARIENQQENTGKTVKKNS